ncbi:MAG: hypothetical protein OEM84_15415 [Acidimicrobiia bacterium]|nr:hypothetical protein [Acidimicrobiia bacterium]
MVATRELQDDTRPNRLRLGIMCDGPEFAAWQAECIKALINVPDVEAALLIVNDGAVRTSSPSKRPRRWLKRFRRLLWDLYNNLYTARRSRALVRVDLSQILGDAKRIYCRVEQRGFSQYFSEVDIAKIRAFDLDFVMRFSFGIIRGDILDSARFGIWSFHHDDETTIRGGPPCFWEIYHGDRITGSVLQRLTNRLDGGVVLCKGWFRTVGHSFVRNRDNAFLGTADWPARVGRQILAGDLSVVQGHPTTSEAPIFHNPTNRQMIIFLTRLARNFIGAQIRGILKHDEWRIGLVDAPIARFLDLTSIEVGQWISAPRSSQYLADPFPVRSGSRTAILVEEYDYRARQGGISAVDVSKGSQQVNGPVLSTGGHASYPFTFQHAGSLYCVPEQAEQRRIDLYKPVDFPYRWEREATLIDSIAALDPTIVYHDGRWWLFCCDDDQDHAKLYLWHSENLLGPWEPHVANPVKIDIRSARPAGGLFLAGDQLYRPAQDGSVTYGGAVAINRILAMTPVVFEEETVVVIEPKMVGPWCTGIHTIAGWDDLTVIDAKRSRFIWPAFRWELTARAGKVRPRS